MEMLFTLPRCKHASSCGGCSRQHVVYASQLADKQRFVEETFAPLLDPTTKFYPILPSASPWEYRNKMEFSFSQDKYNKSYLGLILKGSRGHVFNLEECPLTPRWFAQVVQAVRTWWLESGIQAYRPHRDEGSLRTLTVRGGTAPGERLVMLTVSGNPAYALRKSQLDAFVRAIKAVLPPDEADAVSVFLRVQQALKGSPTQFFEMVLHGPDHIQERLSVPIQGKMRDFHFKVSPTSFFQPNSRQAENLYRRALEMAQVGPDTHVLDLYCGTAPLGLIFSTVAKQVTAIELNPHAVFDAKENCLRNQITNVSLHCGDVSEVLTQLRTDPSFTSDLVIVDPPRCGLTPKALVPLIALLPQKILYISCNPKTQAEDIKALQAAGYRIVELQPVDQFPHTPHIENIALLERA
jgi:23S rRNA (uracil1939-C5)-methyltransferase